MKKALALALAAVMTFSLATCGGSASSAPASSGDSSSAAETPANSVTLKLGFSSNPTVILIMILLIFFIVTMFMESIATLTLFMPILYPIAIGVGIDPIVLSALITVVIGVGLVTPPVGMCIYVACDLMDVKVGDVFPTLIPFLLATFVCIALMITFPQLITLPTALMRV